MESVPLAVVRALGEMGPAARPALDALRKAQEDDDPAVRAAAAAAIRAIEPAPK